MNKRISNKIIGSLIFANILIFTNFLNAQIQFSPQNIIQETESFGPSGIFSADLDGDGLKDVVSTSRNDDKVAWYKNLGGGNFGFQQLVSNEIDSPSDVFLADLNGDSNIDILIASSSTDNTNDNLVWFENDGNGSFTSPKIIVQATQRYYRVFANDIDGDSDLDVLSLSASGLMSWYENDGSASFTTANVITNDDFSSAYPIDFDLDGDIDIISTSESKAGWVENIGSGNFNPFEMLVETAEPMYSESAHNTFAVDLNNDGDNDIITYQLNNDKVKVHLNLGDNTFDQPQVVSEENGFNTVVAFDIDLDGDQDLVFEGDYSKIVWFENDGNGLLSSSQEVTNLAADLNALFATDLDNDGDIDILSASEGDDKIAWYPNDGDGNFELQRELTITISQIDFLNSADLDGDGNLDVIVASHSDSKITWHKNNGAGEFGPTNH